MRLDDRNQAGGLQVTAESWGDWIKYAEERADMEGWHYGGIETGEGREEFSGTPDLPAAIKLARNGWPEGTRQIVDGLTDPAAQANSTSMTAPQWDYDVAGMAPDVAAYMAGEPEHMFTPDFEQMNGQPPVVRLVLPGTYACNVRQPQIVAHGVALLSFVSALQAAGYGVELWWFASTECQGSTLRDSKGEAAGKSWTFAVPVTDPGGTVDIDRAAFALAHPSMLRRLAFAAWDRDKRAKPLGPSYGPAKIYRPKIPGGAQTIDVPVVKAHGPSRPADAIAKLRPLFAELLPLNE